MTLLTVALCAVGFLTAVLSAVAGVGGGSVLIGVFYALGLAPAVAVPLHATVQFTSNFTRTVAFRKHVEWRAAGWFLLTALPTPFLIAPLVAQINVNVVLLLLAGLILTSLVPTREGGEPLKLVPAVLLAGFLNGTLGMFVSATGLFVGRLFLRPEWSKETVVATLAMTQSLGHLVRVLAYASVGFAVTTQLDVLVPLLVATVAGTFAGSWLHKYLDEARFRGLFKAILVVLSLKLIYDGVTGLMA
jgi:uncharacterized membrane protein YfcA